MLLIRRSANILPNLAKNILRDHVKCLSYSNIKVLPVLRYYSIAVKSDLKIDKVDLNDYISKLQQEYTELTKQTNYASNPRFTELQPVVNILTERDIVASNISSLKELVESNDKDVSQLAKDETVELENKLKSLNEELLEALLPVNSEDSFDSIVLEVQAGVGGQEAMLFAQELFDMYRSFIVNKGWDYEIAEYLTTDLGGLRHGSILVNGAQAFRYFKYEAGVHRVQRVPVTEKGGRIHTSTVSVVALPQPTEIDIQIDNRDLKIETKRSSGAGGQHVNTTDSAVRIVHLPTNTMVECQVDRSQIKNRKLAMARLRALLYQKELDSQMAHLAASRKSQVKSNNRNEKIRTYNYNQDRITDHRLQGVHYHNLKAFLAEGADLDDLISRLDRQARTETLHETINNKFYK